MAGLQNKKIEKNLFQNIKMFDKVNNWTLQAEKQKVDIVEEILKKVLELKWTA
jgi:hypothetical protein